MPAKEKNILYFKTHVSSFLWNNVIERLSKLIAFYCKFLFTRCISHLWDMRKRAFEIFSKDCSSRLGISPKQLVIVHWTLVSDVMKLEKFHTQRVKHCVKFSFRKIHVWIFRNEIPLNVPSRKNIFLSGYKFDFWYSCDAFICP